MKRWLLKFLPEAEKDLMKFDHNVKRRIIDKLDWLLVNCDLIVHLPLTGEFKEFYKLRVGDWRIIYRIDWKINLIIVNYIDRRDKIYK
ncbi:MAG: type II toxin-antitoxin system RelE/ParE family toxin [Patescibacteria group bacterium]